MRNTVFVAAVIFAVFACGALFIAGRAQAYPIYKKPFEAKYVQPGMPLFVAWKGETKTCFVCHFAGSTKKTYAAYGFAFKKFVTKKDGKVLTAALEKKINDAFDAVEKLPSDPEDKSSPTFGELIKAGKLPAR